MEMEMKLSFEERGWVTDAELRQILGGVSPMSVYRYRHNPTLNFPKPVKIKSRNLTNYAELMTWMASR